MTKAQALYNFRHYQNGIVKGDVTYTRENWNNFTDYLCKNGNITLKQYESWTNPFWSRISYIKPPTFPTMTVQMQPRKINNTVYDMPTVDGMDRCQINNRLHYINEEMLKLRNTQQALIEMRNQLDRHNEMQEMDNLFDEMFGGWYNEKLPSSCWD